MLLIIEETLQSNQKEFDILNEQNNAMHETSAVNAFYMPSFIAITHLFLVSRSSNSQLLRTNIKIRIIINNQ
jgi:hypothetical protein